MWERERKSPRLENQVREVGVTVNLKKAVGIRQERPERGGFHPENDIDRPISSDDICADGGHGPAQTHGACGTGHLASEADVGVPLWVSGGFLDVVWSACPQMAVAERGDRWCESSVGVKCVLKRVRWEQQLL